MDKPKKKRTASQRLRFVIFTEWSQLENAEISAEDYYQQEMEKIIARRRDQLA